MGRCLFTGYGSLLENTAQKVHAEFIAGNFVVKGTAKSFNQIAADQAPKHINKKAKIAGGLVGIRKVSCAMSRWIIAFSDRTRLLKVSSKMAGIYFNESGTHADLGDKRIARDEVDVKKLLQQIQLFKPFGRTCEELILFQQMMWRPKKFKITFYQVQCVVRSFSQTLLKSDCYLIRVVIFTIRSPRTNPKHWLIWQTYMFLHHHGKVKLLKLTGIYSEFSGRKIDLGDSPHHDLSPCSCVFESNTPTNRHTIEPLANWHASNECSHRHWSFCCRIFSHLKGY